MLTVHFGTSCRDALGQSPDAVVTQKMADTVLQLLDTLLANLHSKVRAQVNIDMIMPTLIMPVLVLTNVYYNINSP